MANEGSKGVERRRRVHLAIGTHWDREWRESFEELRFDLVRLMDHVVDGLENGRLRTPFVTDGQTSVVEDYLAIRPERRARIEALLATGALRTGPWYTMPDEFLVSGESLVRNLAFGLKQSREFGVESSRAGLVCDMFGHNSQLPQILAGFGSPGALIWRGVETEWRSLLWRGADGTELPTHCFGPHGYGSYALSVRGAMATKAPGGEPEHIQAYLDAEIAATPTGPILFFDSCDHQDWDEQAYSALLRQAEGWPAGLELVHSDLDQFLEEFVAELDPNLVVDGELREPGRTGGSEWLMSEEDSRAVSGNEQSVIPGVASSRVYLKQANVRCEALLLQWAEPFSAAASVLAGVEQAPGFAERAWKLILENHAHDSIGGCSVDRVHRDMEHRFDLAEQIAGKLTDDALNKIAASVEGEIGADELRLTIFNPSPRQRQIVHEVDLQIPADWSSFEEFFGYESKPAFRIYDGANEEELSYQRISQRRGSKRLRIRTTKLPEYVAYDVVRVAVEMDVPALGYRTLVVRAVGSQTPTRHPEVPGMVTGGRSMANEHLEVQIEPDGTLTVTDLPSGTTYRGLLAFEDAADIGDGWYHGPVVNTETLASAGPAEISLLADGPLLARFRVVVTMQIPEHFDKVTQQRSERLLPMRLETEVTLRRGAHSVELHTEVVNPAADHRLRVLFPSGTTAETCFSDTPFDVVERPVPLQPDNHTYRELEVETRPHSSWTAVCEDGRGMAILGAGLHEAAVRDLPGRPIALTLFRSTEKTADVYEEPEGQMLGRRLSFDYLVTPVAELDCGKLCELGQDLLGGQRAVQLAAADAAIHRTPHSLPALASFARLDGEVVMTSLRTIDGALEIRAFNPNPEPITATLELHLPVDGGEAQLVRLDGEPLEPLQPNACGSWNLAFGPKQIVTLRVPLDTAAAAANAGERR